MADLALVRDTLQAAVDSGCDDLVACAGSPCCPIPFSELAAHPNDWAATGPATAPAPHPVPERS